MRKNDHEHRSALSELEQWLDSYGADRARWPARDRLKFAELLAASPEARKLLAEAQAFDALLDTAPVPSSEELHALTSRIVTAARAEPKRPAAAAAGTTPRKVSSPSVRTGRLLDWPAAALLAASLVLGIFAGANGVVDGMADGNASSVNAAYDSDADVGALAFGGDSAGILEEDLL